MAHACHRWVSHQDAQGPLKPARQHSASYPVPFRALALAPRQGPHGWAWGHEAPVLRQPQGTSLEGVGEGGTLLTSRLVTGQQSKPGPELERWRTCGLPLAICPWVNAQPSGGKLCPTQYPFSWHCFRSLANPLSRHQQIEAKKPSLPNLTENKKETWYPFLNDMIAKAVKHSLWSPLGFNAKMQFLPQSNTQTEQLCTQVL